MKARRLKRIIRLKSQTDCKQDYQQRECYVERKIEQVYKTYDMSKKDQLAIQTFRSKMQSIQLTIRANS